MNIVAGNMGAAAATTAAADGATGAVMEPVIGAVMGARFGCGVMTPTGALGEGVGSATARG